MKSMKQPTHGADASRPFPSRCTDLRPGLLGLCLVGILGGPGASQDMVQDAVQDAAQDAAQDAPRQSSGIFAGAADDEPVTMTFYAVEDLVALPFTWTPEPTDLDQPLDAEAQRREAMALLESALLADIRDFVLTGLDGVQGASLEFVGEGALLLNGRSDHHTRLLGFLEHRRRFRMLDQIAPSIVMLEPCLLRIARPEGQAKAFDLPGPVQSKEGLDVCLVAEPGAGLWLGDLRERYPDAEEVKAARLSVFPGQPGSIQNTRQVAYVSEYEIETGVAPLGEDVKIANPMIEVVHHGDILDVQAVRVDGERVGLRLKWTSAHLHEPMDIVETEYGLVSRPLVDIRRVETTVVIGAGESAIVHSPGDPDFVLLIAATVVEVESVGTFREGEGR